MPTAFEFKGDASLAVPGDHARLGKLWNLTHPLGFHLPQVCGRCATKSGPGRAVSDQIGGEASGNRGRLNRTMPKATSLAGR